MMMMMMMIIIIIVVIIDISLASWDVCLTVSLPLVDG